MKAFFRRNGGFIAIALILAALGGVMALLPLNGAEKDTPDAPAGHSLDERLSEAAASVSPTARPTIRPLPTIPPAAGAHTPLPTAMPDLTPAPSTAPLPTSESKLNSPVDGRLIKIYAMDSLIYSKTLNQWMTHSGVDISAPKGAEVRCVAAGTVERVYDDDMMGISVLVDHGDGLKTLYCGLKNEPPVSEGDALEARALIGSIGDTAISECADQSHLHFEVWKDGLPQDPTGFVLIPSDGE